MALGMSDIQRHVGLRLSERRQASGMSQEELARRLGVTVAELDQFETGEKQIPPRRLILAAEALKISIGALLEGAPQPDCGQEFSDFTRELIRFLAIPESYALVSAFITIDDREQRQRLVDEARRLGPERPEQPKSATWG